MKHNELNSLLSDSFVYSLFVKYKFEDENKLSVKNENKNSVQILIRNSVIGNSVLGKGIIRKSLDDWWVFGCSS